MKNGMKDVCISVAVMVWQYVRLELLKYCNVWFQEDRRILYVGRIPDHFREYDLEKLFRQFGRIVKTSVHPQTRTNKDNFGFVTFESASSAYEAKDSELISLWEFLWWFCSAVSPWFDDVVDMVTALVITYHYSIFFYITEI